MFQPTPSVAFRLHANERMAQLNAFNNRKEIRWFGFEGSFVEPGLACIRFQRLDEGVLGGGGTHAINGGVISAGFDAAFVLAGLGQYDSDVVVTLELSVQFLNLAEATESLVFEAAVARSSRTFCFVHGILKDSGQASPTVLARASGMVAPGTGRRRTL